MRKLLKTLLYVLAAAVLVACGLIVYLSVTEYRPEASEPAVLSQTTPEKTFSPGDRLSVLSFNMGYGALGKDADFFMDGGKEVIPDSRARVDGDLAGIAALIEAQDADVTMLQEVDTGARRSFGIDERTMLGRGSTAFAYNYVCNFVPYPWPPIGQVHSGLMTMTGAEIQSAERIALPCPFSWPVRMVNLKRCLLVTRLPIEGTDKHLVIINLHLEAYDDGTGKLAQAAALTAYLETAYANGDYVIAGGDFNQVFPGTTERYPLVQENWMPGTLDPQAFSEGWTLAFDEATPTCRLLNQPYDPDSLLTQYYVIDGFLLSPNVELASVETLDCGFTYADHNPVRLEVILK
ncbi:MAG: endonuclease/exonuclease/phosphatase family protein [Clostridiaceae bacterium]|nr:endonuclease/exonuclease/phosphatase family protein [Clostridiaceae bacterium]